MAMEVAKIARILECTDLPAAVLEPLIEASYASQQHSQVLGRTIRA